MTKHWSEDVCGGPIRYTQVIKCDICGLEIRAEGGYHPEMQSLTLHLPRSWNVLKNKVVCHRHAIVVCKERIVEFGPGIEMVIQGWLDEEVADPGMFTEPEE